MYYSKLGGYVCEKESSVYFIWGTRGLQSAIDHAIDHADTRTILCVRSLL
jgi:hypothetical protein